jgi:hypothetical protein
MNPKLIRICHAVALLVGVLGVMGCERAGYRSPTVDVLGSYFPAWMISILSGLILTLIARGLLVVLRLDTELRPAALVHLCLWVVLTLGAWIVLFKN